MRNKSISSQFLLGLGALALLLPSATLRGQESSIPPGKEVYMGRRIAQTMHFTGAPWLIRNTREREERCSLMLANLGIKPMPVANTSPSPLQASDAAQIQSSDRV